MKLKKEGKADVSIYCVFGRPPKIIKEITWYRYRASGNAMVLLTMDSESNIIYENPTMKGKFAVQEEQKSLRNRTIKLLNVNHLDISKYWCQVKPPSIYRNDWRNSSLLRVEGLNLLLFGDNLMLMFHVLSLFS